MKNKDIIRNIRIPYKRGVYCGKLFDKKRGFYRSFFEKV